MDHLPIFEATFAALNPPDPHGRHRLSDERFTVDTEEIPMGRHHDDNHDGVADHPAPPAPVAPIGPDDPDHPAYQRTGDHEPLRWTEPTPEALDALRRAAEDVDDAWLALAAQPIDPRAAS